MFVMSRLVLLAIATLLLSPLPSKAQIENPGRGDQSVGLKGRNGNCQNEGESCVPGQECCICNDGTKTVCKNGSCTRITQLRQSSSLFASQQIPVSTADKISNPTKSIKTTRRKALQMESPSPTDSTNQTSGGYQAGYNEGHRVGFAVGQPIGQFGGPIVTPNLNYLRTTPGSYNWGYADGYEIGYGEGVIAGHNRANNARYFNRNRG